MGLGGSRTRQHAEKIFSYLTRSHRLSRRPICTSPSVSLHWHITRYALPPSVGTYLQTASAYGRSFASVHDAHTMDAVLFERDPGKAVASLAKHGVYFSAAADRSCADNSRSVPRKYGSAQQSVKVANWRGFEDFEVSGIQMPILRLPRRWFGEIAPRPLLPESALQQGNSATR